MREYRFRVWNKINKTMCKLAKITFYDDSNKVRVWDLSVESEYMLVENIEIMQYTGLKDDANKTNIYEGDIVEFEFGEKLVNGIIVFDEGSFKIRWKQNNFFFYANTVKVIGNIYENPELLYNE